jgi:hypothetical protein
MVGQHQLGRPVENGFAVSGGGVDLRGTVAVGQVQQQQ